MESKRQKYAHLFSVIPLEQMSFRSLTCVCSAVLLIGGFGNLQGYFDIWDPKRLKKIGAGQVHSIALVHIDDRSEVVCLNASVCLGKLRRAN
jgi:hypothetical protein